MRHDGGMMTVRFAADNLFLRRGASELQENVARSSQLAAGCDAGGKLRICLPP
jgi:hypothetical protein